MAGAWTAVVLAAAICAPATWGAVLVGFGAAPRSGDGPVGPGDEIEYTIRVTGESPSPYVVSVNGEHVVGEGDAEPGVTTGRFTMPDVDTNRDSVSVAVVVDDPDSEPRSVTLDYRATPAPPTDGPASEPRPEEPPATPAPAPAQTQAPPAQSEQREPAAEAPAPGDAAAEPGPAPAGAAPAQTAPTAPAGAAPRGDAPAASPTPRDAPARARRGDRTRERPRDPAPSPAPTTAPDTATGRARVLRGSVGADARTGLPQRGAVRAPRPAAGGGVTDAGADDASSPPSSRGGAADDTAEDDGAAAAPREADAPPAAANDSSGSGAMIFVLAAAALAALVAGVAAYRVRVRSRRYDELLGPVAPEQPPTHQRPRTPRSEPLNLTGSGARDREP